MIVEVKFDPSFFSNSSQPLVKSAPDQFDLIANLRTLCTELEKDNPFFRLYERFVMQGPIISQTTRQKLYLLCLKILYCCVIICYTVPRNSFNTNMCRKQACTWHDSTCTGKTQKLLFWRKCNCKLWLGSCFPFKICARIHWLEKSRQKFPKQLREDGKKLLCTTEPVCSQEHFCLFGVVKTIWLKLQEINWEPLL